VFTDALKWELPYEDDLAAIAESKKELIKKFID